MERQTAIAEIKQRIRCKDHLQKSKGADMYCCPFCTSGEKIHGTGALKVYDTNTWFCHACKKSGDVLDLIQEEYHTDFNGALEIAANELGITIDRYDAIKAAQEDFSKPVDRNTARQEKVQNEPAERHDEADYTAYYRECAQRLNSPEAVSYLSARGISLDTAVALGLGFDPKADPARGGHQAPRIIMPTGPAHYVGRSIDPNTDKAYQKINVKGGTPGIFNEPAIYAGDGPVFVTEGVFDAMSVCEMGKRAIALNSTSNTGKLLDQLRKKPAASGTAFIVCFDNDEDPTTAARTNAAADALNSGLSRLGYKSIKANIAGNYKDANEALQAYRPAFAELLEAAEKELNRDYLTDFLDKIQTEAYKPYTTELSFFDNLLMGGVIQQSLLILMAAPGIGKTTLCQQIAEEMAAHRKPVIYINLEMSREQMLAKAISYRLAKKDKTCKTALDILQGYKWSADERATIIAEIEAYRQQIYPYLQYNPDNIKGDLDSILEYLDGVGQRAKDDGRQAPAVFIDYLHLIGTTKGLDNQELIKQTVKGLKDYAVNYDTFVVGISATNRASNTSGRITMESGRDSSNIEYTGDYQLSLNYYAVDNGTVKTDNLEKMAELQEAKWRQMIIRVLKGRFVTPGRKANIYFNAANNIFYGENDFLPADDEITPFDNPKKPAASGLRL